MGGERERDRNRERGGNREIERDGRFENWSKPKWEN